MKKISRFLKCIIAVAVIFSFLNAYYVYADDVDSTDTSTAPQVLYSVRGQDAPADLLKELDALSVHVDANTWLKIVSLQSSASKSASNSSSALLVINKDGSTITVDSLLAVDSDGVFLSILAVDNNLVSPRAGETVYIPYYENYLIKATAVFNEVVDPDDYLVPYYQPVGMYFIYYANGVNTLSYAEITYDTDGVEYTYPGFVQLNGGALISHSITRSVNNPASNTIYQQVNAYPTNKAIDINAGYFAGMSFSYYLIINGSPCDDTIVFAP